MNTNKYDVPYHCYTIKLADGTTKFVDIGCEEDWGDIQRMLPTDVFKDDDSSDYYNKVGFGNDSDGHIEIVEVIDTVTDENINVREWGEYVWSFVDNYSC